ncbi:hypothetical protein MJO29_001316 [Puccinia striiformis f. sp. tritici]|nr:hypothetical protein MJO29_001316 [Puccinia striiformis f. sp. tritici]
MILNVPAGVVAVPPSTLGQEAEPAARDARSGGLGFGRSGRSDEPFRGKSSPSTTYSSEHMYKGVKVSDEDTLLGLVRRKDKMVTGYEDYIRRYGYDAVPNLRAQRPPLSLEQMASAQKAYQEHRLEIKLSENLYSESNEEKWNLDPIYLKFRDLKQLNSKGKINSQEAQQAINRLSFLEYKGFDFSKEQGQLIEKLSEQAHNPLGYVEQELALTNEDRKLIEDIAWERVVAKKVDEITKNWQHFELMALAKSKKDARKIMGVSDNRELTDFELLALSTVISEARTILRALENMKLIMSHDTAQWSPEAQRLLETINKMETGGDSPHLEPDYKDLEIIRQLDQTAFWINWENRAQRIAQAQLAAKPINRIRKFLKQISPI